MFKNMGGNVLDRDFLSGSFPDTDVFNTTKSLFVKSASFYFKRLYIAFVKSTNLQPNKSKSVSKIFQISIKTLLKI